MIESSSPAYSLATPGYACIHLTRAQWSGVRPFSTEVFGREVCVIAVVQLPFEAGSRLGACSSYRDLP